MLVDLKVHYFCYYMGSEEFFNAFFNTVNYNIERGNPGARYPTLFSLQQHNMVPYDQTNTLRNELSSIKKSMDQLDSSKAVWQLDDIQYRPEKDTTTGILRYPVGNLSDYFVTLEGDKYFDIFDRALGDCDRLKRELLINKY